MWSYRHRPVTKLAILAIRSIRQTMERDTDSHYLRDESFIHLLRHYLRCHGNPELQIEACWIFTNIAAGKSEHTQILVKFDVIPLLIDLLASQNLTLVEQAIWALGNVVGESTKLRDMVLAYDILPSLTLYVDSIRVNASFLRTLVWFFVNLVRCREDPPPLEVAELLAPCFLALIEEQLDIVTRVDGFWGLTYISDCGNDYIQVVIDSGVVPSVIGLLSFEHTKIQLGAIRVLGNIAAGTDEQTQYLLSHGITLSLHFLLFHDSVAIRRLTLWCLSNITVGPVEQLHLVLAADLMPGIAHGLVQKDAKTVREATLTVRNLLVGCEKEYLDEILNSMASSVLFDLLECDDREVANAAEEALTALLRKLKEWVNYYQQLRI